MFLTYSSKRFTPGVYYSFGDGFSPKERQLIEGEIIKHVPSEPGHYSFNGWRFWKDESTGKVYAARLTWELGPSVKNSVEEIIKFLQEYHGVSNGK